MKTTRKTILAITLVLVAFSLPLLAQDIGSDGKDSASLETLKQDLLKLGNDLKITASEAGDLVSQWLSSTGADLGEKATAATIQTKLGVVLETNKDNLSVTIVDASGKTSTFVATEDTPILIQDAVAGLQTPFADGKTAKFKHIKKGDWIHYSFSLKDAVQQVLPNATSGPIQVQAIDILR